MVTAGAGAGVPADQVIADNAATARSSGFDEVLSSPQRAMPAHGFAFDEHAWMLDCCPPVVPTSAQHLADDTPLPVPLPPALLPAAAALGWAMIRARRRSAERRAQRA